MATIRKRAAGSYEAQVRRKGQKTVSKTFQSSKDAQRWARSIEEKMDRSAFVDYSLAERLTVGDVVERYATEILPMKKSHKEEMARVKSLKLKLGHLILARLSSMDLAQYRDERLQSVGSQTVIHELGLLNRSLKAAVLDWGVVLPNGVPAVRKPTRGRGRDRRLQGDEYVRLLESSDPIIQPIIEFAVETALRRGEIEKARREDIDLARRVMWVRDTKNGDDRVVALSTRAVSVIRKLPLQINGELFGVKAHTISRRFLKACRAAGIDDLRFHDLRHEAVSRLFEKGLNPMEVSSISGHKTLQMLKRYTHLRAEDLAMKLG